LTGRPKKLPAPQTTQQNNTGIAAAQNRALFLPAAKNNLIDLIFRPYGEKAAENVSAAFVE
jgi:hypothetical protein